MLTSHRPLTVIEDGGLTNLSPVTAGHAPTSGLDALTLQAVRESLRDRMSATLLDPVAPASVRDPEVLRVLRAEIGHQVEAGYGPLRHLPTDERSLLRLFQEALGWGPAQPYLDDERIQEVKIIGDLIMVQEEGADFSLVAERFQDPRQALDRAMLLAARLNVPLDRSRPQDTLPLAHGTRMHVTIPPCTPDGTGLICIRRGRRYAWVLDDLLRRRACDQVVGDLLRLLVRAGCSFIIAGETGCGKTALLEALVNSWPGEPHVITIEDNTLEINVRHRAWTRELVQTAVERGAFGRAAREVLRQTPSLVAPGETRADEAGAILAVAVSGHAVVTTIHARSAARAVSRFADCAAMPGAYIYEGRRDHALEDTCDNFQVVIHLEKVSGRRYIDEILLLDGVEAQGERLRPRFVPLARVKHTEGEVTWHVEAVAHDDRLVWQTEARTPEALQRRFELLQLRADVRAAATTHAAVSEAIARASAVTRSGDATQALAILRRAWSDRRDQRLVTAAQRVLELDLEAASTMAIQSRQAEATIQATLGSRRWPDARAAYGEVMADLAIVAAHSPAGGWEHLERTIAAGEDRDYLARSQIAEARLALTQGRARDAVDLLTQCDPMVLSKSVALETLATRRDALAILHAAGEIGGDALGPVQAALEALTT
ncbi:ATPase, T2SS/T4P/T4SS family [Candidatus Chloroploca sp. Khr17]|uniref:ATPase, T2SS/T4P/T4SS family n=1 Tax=Candidatus Chloroploca sp. Khr17 TaxID=2496869 RepID=UPI00101C9B6B|nr:ATPase, T2SS/T4P/T4SS family [Candidatus Chloroploca sp. Khr17]